MIGLDTLVYLVILLIVGALVIGLCWWLILYVESQGLGPPVLFKIVRVVFVILVVLFLISVLLGMVGHPVVRF